MDLPLAWLVTFRHVFFGNVFSRHYPSGENVEREREKGVLRGEYKDVSLSKTVCTTNGPKKNIIKYQCVSKFIDSATKMT